jgi:hypothetical protein
MATILGVRKHTELEIREAGPNAQFPSARGFAAALWRFIRRYTVGTGAGMRDRGFQQQYTIAAGATQVIDLAGALTDRYGSTVTFAKVTEIRVINHSTTLAVSIGPTAGGVGFGIGTWWTLVGDRSYLGVAASADEPAEFFQSNPVGAGVTATTADKFDITAAAGSGSTTVTVQIVGKSA